MDSVLRRALGRLHYGLYFLSAGTLGDPVGMPVSWVSQVSGDPPLLMTAVRHNRSLLPLLKQRASFAINLLPADDRELLARVGRPAETRFQGLELAQGPEGIPWLARGAGALFLRDCTSHAPGDHELFTGLAFAAAGDFNQDILSVADLGHVYLGLS